MRTIIAGPRTLNNPALLNAAMLDATNNGLIITHILSGGAEGFDTLGEQWAIAHHMPWTRYKAEWAKYDRAAGPIRNEIMARNAQALLTVWNGQSKGTGNMISLARQYQLRIWLYIYRDGKLLVHERNSRAPLCSLKNRTLLSPLAPE